MFKRFTQSAVLGSFLVLSGCASGGGIGGGGSVTLEQEWQLGDQLAAQVEQQVKLVRDPRALAYVRSVGERLHRQTPLADRPFDFEIVDDPSVNAFAIPGGHVYIHRGLIEQADKADMLAGVMAHEISHVVARHAIKQVEQAQTINVIGSILLGQSPGVAQQIIAQIVAGGAMARFSRADEKQADDMGLELTTRAGFNPNGMLEMFQKLLALEKSRPGAVERFFSDHPMTEDRIKDIQKRITAMGSPNGIVDEPEYQAVRASL